LLAGAVFLVSYTDIWSYNSFFTKLWIKRSSYFLSISGGIPSKTEANKS